MKRARGMLVAVTALFVGLWLLLAEAVSIGGVLLGLLIALFLVWAARDLDLPPGRFRRPRAALNLAFVVLGDIIRSNMAVARIILGPRSKRRTSGFLRIPLDIRAPYGLATLACIITATPGTIWVSYDSATNTVLLHILDLVDEKVWFDTIKGRYERRLMEIFE